MGELESPAIDHSRQTSAHKARTAQKSKVNKWIHTKQQQRPQRFLNAHHSRKHAVAKGLVVRDRHDRLLARLGEPQKRLARPVQRRIGAARIADSRKADRDQVPMNAHMHLARRPVRHLQQQLVDLRGVAAVDAVVDGRVRVCGARGEVVEGELELHISLGRFEEWLKYKFLVAKK